MILIFAAMLVLASVPLSGGHLSRLTTLDLRRKGLLGAAMAIQFVVLGLPPTVLPVGVSAAFHVFSFMLGLGFVWANRRIRGIDVIALGGLSNLLAIATNGGVMPASRAALRAAGIPLSTHGAFRNSSAVTDPHLAWLGDVFAIPKGWPLANVFSVGDVLVIVGMAVVVHTTCGSLLVGTRDSGPERISHSIPAGADDSNL